MKVSSKPFDKKYEPFVAHPRYGRAPRYTALNPDPYDARVHLHWNATNVHEIQKRNVLLLGKRSPALKTLEGIVPEQLPRVAGTAIAADPAKQNNATVPVTHYYDIEKVC